MAVSLHSAGLAHARSLIASGAVDESSDWSFSAEDSNALLGDPPDWSAYRRWFLGHDTAANTQTKDAWKYPFGKLGKLYRSALRAIASRAAQQGETEISNAASGLIADLDAKTTSNLLQYRPRAAHLAGEPSRDWFRIVAKSDANPNAADIYLYDLIGSGWFSDGVSAKTFIDELRAIPRSVTTLHLHINSAGGDLFDALAISNALRQHAARKNVLIEGLCASAATIVSSAGDVISMADNALMMIHDPRTMTAGTAEELRATANGLDRARAAIIASYRRISSKSADELGAMMSAETWMTADEAIANGLATQKLTGLKAVAQLHQEAVASLTVPRRFRSQMAALVQTSALGSVGRITAVAGVPASQPLPRRDPSMSTVSDRIVGFKAERTKIANQMKTLMQPVVDGTGELSADQQQQYDGLMADLQSTDGDIRRFEALERADVIPSARPLTTPTDFQGGSDVRDHSRPRVVTVTPNRPPEMEFVRAVICKVAGKVLGVSPLDVAKQRYPDERGVLAFLNAAVAGGTTTDGTWAGPLTAVPQTLVAAFLDFLRPMTIVGKFGTGGIPSLTMTPFNIRVQSQTSGGSAQWVGQGKMKPVTKFDYDDVNLGFAKLAAISVISDELVRFSNPSSEARVRDALAAAVVERQDVDFIDPNKTEDTNVSPASITNGITALVSSGTDADAVRADVRALLGAFINANIDPTTLVWIMPTTIALALTLMRNALGQREFPDITMRGGQFEGFPVISSQYANIGGSPAENLVIAVSAKDIFLADDGGVNVTASLETSIAMSDDPENDEATPVSMFQSNQVALRAERYINWKRGRDEAVAWMDNVAWGTV